MEFLTGKKWNVDHIIPLSHPRVSGLHVAGNLRVITFEQNMAKSNEWNPDQLDMFVEPEQLKLF